MPVINVYSVGGSWTSALPFTYISGTTPQETLDYDDNNNSNDNILDDWINVGFTNQQGQIGDTASEMDSRTQSINQTTLFGETVTGLNVSTGTMYEFNGSDGSTLYGSHIVTNNGTSQTGPITGQDGYWVFSEHLIDGVTYTPNSTIGFNPNGSIDISNTVCFTRNTMIDTDAGEVAVQNLTAGMMVRTRDNGFQSIRWVGMSPTRDRAVRIKAGAMGNTRDLVVSPRHRMVLDGWQLELLFDHDQALVTALELINDDTIVRDEMTNVEYYHVMFDAHEVIYAEGAATESFHPDQPSMGSMDAAAREEIFALFPDLRDGAKRAQVAANLSPIQAAYVGKNIDAFLDS